MSTRKKIKVLETIRQGKIGGGETHVLDLVRELNKDLYEPVVLSFTDGPMIDTLKEMGIKTYVIHTETPFDIRKWKQVRQVLEMEEIDILHAHGTRANSNTFWSARQLGIPIIYTVHGWSFHPDQQPLVKKLRIMGEKLLTKNSDVTVCVSHSNLNDGKQLFDLSRATVVNYGINATKFNPDGQYKDIRSEFNIPKDVLLVGYIARITIQKDPFTLIKAIHQIPAGINIHFLIVGDGELKDKMVKLAQELNIQHRITFVPFRQDVPAILHAIDIYCLPSLWEGLPIGLLEAMAMRKAVVASAIDGTKEAIASGKNGLLIPPSSPEKLAEALILLAKDEALRQRLSLEAYATVAATYNVEEMTRHVESLYNKVLSAPEKDTLQRKMGVSVV